MTLRAVVALLSLLAGAAGVAAGARAAPTGQVVVVPIHGTIDDGMAHLVRRAVDEARDAHARALVLDVDTPGGLVRSATEIRDVLLAGGVPVDAYVARAWSAGALVTLAADRVVMNGAGSIGAAQPIPANEKTISALRAEFEATASSRHRDPRVAGAMVDGRIDLPAYKEPGRILTLTADQARAAGISEASVVSFGDALRRFGVAGAPRANAEYTLAERIARLATNPELSGVLLALGFLGLLVELQTLHLVAGAIGAAALALFFGAHVYAGFSNLAVVALALAGVVLILFELHVLPGHGVAGILGVVTLVASVLLAFGIPFLIAALQALAVAIVLSAVAFALLQRVLPENAFVRRLTFAGAQGPDYVAAPDYRALLGRTGVALSFLRPAGVAAFDDERVDVLSEGEFVPAGKAVRVTRVEGARIFVRPETEEES